MPSLKSSAVIEKLRRLFATHGLPDLVVSDNGTAFVSKEMQTFLKLNGVRFMYTAPYHPSSNGRAERMVRELKSSLKKQKHGDTFCKVSRFLFKQHSTPHATTGKTPAELMMGRKLRSPLDKLHPDKQREPEELPRAEGRSFRPGDLVYCKNFGPGHRWMAAKVVGRCGRVMYRVQTSSGEVHRRHANQLRRAWFDWSQSSANSARVTPDPPQIEVPSPSGSRNGQGSESAPPVPSPVPLRRQHVPIKRYGIDYGGGM